MSITNLFGPKRPPGAPTCHTCNGRGSKRGGCARCGGKGVVNPNSPSYYMCPDCDNGRCRTCGGEGVPVGTIQPTQSHE